LLAAYIENNDQILLTPGIAQEILQRIREDAQFSPIKNILSYMTVFHVYFWHPGRYSTLGLS
jgi:hypothetical protein